MVPASKCSRALLQEVSKAQMNQAAVTAASVNLCFVRNLHQLVNELERPFQYEGAWHAGRVLAAVSPKRFGPELTPDQRLSHVLHFIESVAASYHAETGRALTIVFDGLDDMLEQDSHNDELKNAALYLIRKMKCWVKDEPKNDS